eukprot:scaffold148651_cov31-Tisochrysis_lutea.AAC.3
MTSPDPPSRSAFSPLSIPPHLDREHEKPLRCFLVMVSEPKSGGELRNVPLTVGESHLATLLGKSQTRRPERRGRSPSCRCCPLS